MKISGGIIIWQEQGGSTDIYSYDIAAGTQKPIAATTQNECCASIAGNRIVYSFYDGSSRRIALYDVASGAKQDIAQASTFSDPVVDGNTVVYDTDPGNLYLYDISTGETKELGTNSNGPSISGDDIVWGHDPDKAVYHYKISTKTTRVISPAGAKRIFPQVSNGTVVYQDYNCSGGTCDVYTYDLSAGTETKRIAISSGSNHGFSISDKKFVWSEGYNDSAVNYVYDLNTGVKTAFASAPSYKSTPWISGTRAVWLDGKYSGGQTYDVLWTDVAQLAAFSSPDSRTQLKQLAAIAKSLQEILGQVSRLLK